MKTSRMKTSHFRRPSFALIALFALEFSTLAWAYPMPAPRAGSAPPERASATPVEATTSTGSTAADPSAASVLPNAPLEPIQFSTWPERDAKFVDGLAACAKTTGVEMLTLETPRDVARLDLPADDRRKVRRALDEGQTVRAPAEPLFCGGGMTWGYSIVEKGTAYQRVISTSALAEAVEAPIEAEPECPVEAEPIDVVNGRLELESFELSLATSLGPDLGFQRFYSSGDETPGALGTGWTHDYEMTVSEDVGVELVLAEADGDRYRFVEEEPFVYRAPDRTGLEAAKTDRGFTVRSLDGRTRHFDDVGQLTKITDRHGHTLKLDRDKDGRISRVTDALGRTLTLTYGENGLLREVRDVLERRYEYSYLDGRLAEAALYEKGKSEPVTSTLYGYDEAGRLSSIGGDEVPTEVSYDDAGRVAKIVEGGETVRSYAYQPRKFQTVITNSQNANVTVSYNSAGQITQVTQPDGTALSYVRTLNGFQVSTQDHGGSFWTETFDAQGRLIQRTDPAGNSETFTYNTPFNLPSTYTDRLGIVTTMVIDPSNGNVLSITDGEGATFSMTYNAQGQVTSLTDRRGQTSFLSWDPVSGELAQAALPLGVTWNFTHDAAGRKIGTVDPEGGVWSYTYDAQDQLTQMVDPLGAVNAYQYNGQGKRTRWTRRDGSEVNLTYNAAGRLTSLTDPAGRLLQFNFKASGCSCAEGSDLLKQLTTPSGGVWNFTYDNRGRLRTATDPNGAVTTYEWDPRNMPTKKIYPDGSYTEYICDVLGRLVTIRDSNGEQLSFQYDNDGRLLLASNAATTQTWTYDNVGRVLNFADALTGKSLAYTYDGGGNRTQLVDGEGLVSSIVHDALGRPATVTDGSGDVFSFTRDNVSRITSIAYPNGQTTDYTYDGLGNVTQHLLSGPTGLVFGQAISRDVMGRMSSRFDLQLGTTTYNYDLIGQLTGVNLGANPIEAFAYDQTGNRTADLAGNTATYDAADRVTQYGNTTYTYDGRGNVILESAPGGNTVYTYDWNNRLKSALLPSGTLVEIDRDPFGRTIERRVNGVATRYLRDGQEILARYDGRGAVTAKYTRLGNSTRLLAVDRPSDGGRFYLHQDLRYSVVAVTDPAGNLTARTAYYGFGRPVVIQGAWDDPIAYLGRDWDADLELHDLQARHYDPDLGRFLQPDPLGFNGGSFNVYHYSGNDPINVSDPDGDLFGLIVVIVAVVVVAAGTAAFVDAVSDMAEQADKAQDIRDRMEEADTIEEMIELEKERAGVIKDGLKAGMDAIKNAPMGTSLTGPVSNPFNPIDAGGIIVGEGIKRACDPGESEEDD